MAFQNWYRLHGQRGPCEETYIVINLGSSDTTCTLSNKRIVPCKVWWKKRKKMLYILG